MLGDNQPVAIHATEFIDSYVMMATLDILIDEMDCINDVPVEIHRYVTLDGDFHDLPLTPLEYFNVNAFLYGVEEALRMQQGEKSSWF